MKKVIKILNKAQFGSLATIEIGEPRVRPFQFQFEENGKIYFCTSSEKEITKQLQKIPIAEFTAFDKALNYVRIYGEVNFCSNIEMKTKVFKLNPYYKDWFGSVENENMVLFYINHGRALIGNYSTYPPEILKF